MKKIILIASVIFSLTANAQNDQLSSASEFLERTSYTQINLDENEKALFKSGLGETVVFYPAEIIDLKSNESINGLAVESTFIIANQGMSVITTKETAWVGMEEIGDMVVWFEQFVIPNLEASAGKNKAVKYIFNSKEVKIKFEVYGNKQMLSVIMNHSYFPEKYFWTETRVKDIPAVLAALKYLQAKK